MGGSLRGHLLIAAPSLFDYFRRSVILVLEHSDEGAMGVVLNRRSETLVVDAVPALAALPGAEEAVFVGGPVAPARSWRSATSTTRRGGTHLAGRSAPSIRAGRLRPFSACASMPGTPGWAAGQFDDELGEGAWIVEPAEPEDPFTDGDIWSEALRRKGGELLAAGHDARRPVGELTRR